MRTDATELSGITRRWLNQSDRSARKQLGQFMTPLSLRERLLDQIDLPSNLRVLDPGVGTGEFLASVRTRQPSAQLFGWDTDPAILSFARDLVPSACLQERSALDPYVGEPFDLVIGNPPYFQFRAPKEVRTYFARVISGRPNIFALFFQVGFEALRPGGQLAYVVPPSMNNGAYFERLRQYIVDCGAVEYLEVFNDSFLFEGANTPVQLLVARKGAIDTGKHVIVRESPSAGFRRTLFLQSPQEYQDQFDGRSTLYDLGYEAVTGSVVWNQNRELLRLDSQEGTVPLIWAHNIVEEVTFSHNPAKPQYILSGAPLLGPAIVLNRIVGSVGSGVLKCALVPSGMRFLAENHTNVIRVHAHFPPKIGFEDLLTALREPGFVNRARMLTGNTQISATELTHLLPVDA